MNKHTPGPWAIGTPPPNGEQTIGDTSGLMVAVATTGETMPTKANARLIAAAPELLEALKGLTHALDFYDLLHDDQRRFFNAAMEAIAKATGESQ